LEHWERQRRPKLCLATAAFALCSEIEGREAVGSGKSK
jgi:hypothetical protein